LPQDLPFGTAQRLLGWMAHEADCPIIKKVKTQNPPWAI